MSSRALQRSIALTGSLLVTVAVAELVCRVRVHRLNEESLDAAFSRPFQQSQEESATLADIIRPVTNDRIAYELRPGLQGIPFKGAPLSTDSRGFRSPEHPPEPGPSTVTIVGIGDSIQFGHGVGDGENYLDQLVVLLNERHPEVTWRHVNTAVPGYNTVMEVETLERKGLVFQPDLVLQGVCGNDYEPPVYVRDVDDVFDLSRSFFAEFLAERASGESATARRAREAISHRGTWSEESGSEAPPRYAELYGEAPFESALDRLAELSSTSGFEVLSFATVDYANTPEMMASCARRGFETVHLQGLLEEHYQTTRGEPFTWEGYTTSDLVVSPQNLHPSVLQHRMAAELLHSTLEESGWIERMKAR